VWSPSSCCCGYSVTRLHEKSIPSIGHLHQPKTTSQDSLRAKLTAATLCTSRQEPRHLVYDTANESVQTHTKHADRISLQLHDLLNNPFCSYLSSLQSFIIFYLYTSISFLVCLLRNGPRSSDGALLAEATYSPQHPLHKSSLPTTIRPVLPRNV